MRKMLKFETVLDKLIFLVLLTYFSWTLFDAGKKMNEGKIGLSVSNPFSQFRLFPSMSICITTVQHEELLKDIDGNLQKVLDDVLIQFVHKNFTHSGTRVEQHILSWNSTKPIERRPGELKENSKRNDFLKNFTRQKIDKSALFAHLKRSDHPEVCLAYEPLGPTKKSWDGVTHLNISCNVYLQKIIKHHGCRKFG